MTDSPSTTQRQAVRQRPRTRHRRPIPPPPRSRMTVREVLIGAFACIGLFLSGVLVGGASDPFRLEGVQQPKTVVVFDADPDSVSEP